MFAKEGQQSTVFAWVLIKQRWLDLPTGLGHRTNKLSFATVERFVYTQNL